MFRGIATVSFYADDIQATKGWYSQLLGVEAYSSNSPEGRPACVKSGIGDYLHELGIIDRRFTPHHPSTLDGALTYWHVDDLSQAFERLVSMGATVHEPITKRGTSGFVTASVIDPFGNVIGIMNNPHYLDILNRGAASK
jgi:predicted enzyme related to lactoylglutathione lyase